MVYYLTWPMQTYFRPETKEKIKPLKNANLKKKKKNYSFIKNNS